MLLPGCPCCGSPCPECNRPSLDDCDSVSGAGSYFQATVGTTSVPRVPPYYAFITPPSSVQGCYSGGLWTAKLFYWPNENAQSPFNMEHPTINGCVVCEPYTQVRCELYLNGIETAGLYRRLYFWIGACSDTGGAASAAASWAFWYSYAPDPCSARILEWLNSLSFSGTFTAPTCACPP